MSLHYTTINLETFNSAFARYDEIVPYDLRDLDTARYKTIPNALAERKEKEDVYLKKDEVVKLVRWKLYVLRVSRIAISFVLSSIGRDEF
jgi:hypothetical protein